jgi:subtilisin family serine protease
MHFYLPFVVAAGVCLATSPHAVSGENSAPKYKKERGTGSSGSRRKGADPEIGKAWHLDAIGARNAWKTTRGTADIQIAIVDSGVHYNHPDLIDGMALNSADIPGNGIDDDENGYPDDYVGWDFIWSNGLPFDRSGHGTFLASIIGARADNGVGSAGVCPECSIIPVRYLNYEGLGDTEDAIEGIRYATLRGASVINLSFSGEGYDAEMKKAIEEAGKKDILVIAAASNDESNLDNESIYPAKFKLPNLITVAASTRKNELVETSNWGKKSVHLAAPGDDILGIWEGKWDVGSGTSNAAAVLSGAAGLVRAANPGLTAVQTKSIILATVRKSAALKGKMIHEGVLNVEAAVDCAVKTSLPCLKGEKKAPAVLVSSE